MTQTQTKPCSTCGTPAAVEIPDDLGGVWREMLERLPISCDTCADKVEDAEKRREADAERERWLKRVDQSRVPRDWIGITFEDMDRTESQKRARAIEDAESWGAGEIQGLVLSGPVGVGKSRLAGAAACARLRREPLDWMQVPGLVTRARAGYDTEARKEVTRLLTRPRRGLILDDLDKVKPTEFVQDLLFQVIDERVSNGAPLLVTTNLVGKEVADLLGDPIRSRLAGYCKAHWIEGRDRRRQPDA